MSEQEFDSWLKARNGTNKKKQQAEREKETGTTVSKPLFEGDASPDLRARHSAICERLGAPVAGEGETLRAVCPCCADPNPSFVMTLSADKILIFCHALCTQAELCESLGIEQKHLFAKSQGDQSEQAVDDDPTVAQHLSRPVRQGMAASKDHRAGLADYREY